MTDTKPCKNTTGGPGCEDDDNFRTELFGAAAPGGLMILEECGLTPREAACKAGIDYETFFGVMTGVEPITKRLASKLPAAVGSNEKFWLRSEQSYQDELARDSLQRPTYDPVEAERVADQVLGPAEDGLTEMELPIFDAEDDSLPE